MPRLRYLVPGVVLGSLPFALAVYVAGWSWLVKVLGVVVGIVWALGVVLLVVLGLEDEGGGSS